MKKHLIFAFGSAALLLLAACETTHQGNGNDGDSLAHTPDTVAVHQAANECANLGPGQFCATGLDILRLGDSLTWNPNIQASLPDAVLKDTVITEANADGDSISWFAKILRFPDGDIYMDADFEQGQFLGRVRIESGRYHHSSGLRVGSTARELKAFTPTAYVSYFAAYDLMEVVVPYDQSRLIFHFPAKGIYQDSKAEYALTDIPDDTKVVRIVLM